jgi:hypothetical protein
MPMVSITFRSAPEILTPTVFDARRQHVAVVLIG